MAKRAKGLPRPPSVSLSKSQLLNDLQEIDKDTNSQQRVAAMEVDFRSRIGIHLDALAKASKPFRKYNTNPFVLLMYSSQKQYRRVKETEAAIVPAKVFSSMETSAGKMVERVMLSHYGWECVDSAMHTTESVVDGRKLDGDTLRLVTLKSGPNCINDSMTDSISSEIVKYAADWGRQASVKKVEFTIGILYGTPKMSNKKDWHILRKAALAVQDSGSKATLVESPDDKWQFQFKVKGVAVTANIRIGKSFWDHLGCGCDAYTEMLCAAIRSCIEPTNRATDQAPFIIPDLESIVELPAAYAKQSFVILQQSQLEWFMLLAAHFCESLTE